jgi:hypothetical protein
MSLSAKHAMVCLGLFALACQAPTDGPRVNAISPSAALKAVQVDVTLNGAAFDVQVTSNIETGEVELVDLYSGVLSHQESNLEVSIEGMTRLDAESITGTVPSDIPAGIYDLTIEGPSGRSNTLVGAYQACYVLSGEGLCIQGWPLDLDSSLYRKHIEIPSSQPGTVLRDFPLLIKLVDSDLAENALDSGFDIVFSDSDGGLLEHELEHFDSATGELVAWVKIPTLDTSTDTELYMYYGGPSTGADASVSTVWSNGFYAVWHLYQAGLGNAGEFLDSSGSGNDATGGAGAATETPSPVASPLGRGQDFDGVNDYISSPIDLSDRTSLTLSLWTQLRQDDNTATPGLAGQNNVLEMGFFWDDRINLWSAAMTINCPGKGLLSLCTDEYVLNTWFHLAVVYDGSEIALFVDGLEKHRVPLTSLGSAASTFSIGGKVFSANGGNLDGTIDEVRLASVPRSAAWVALEYANQSDPSSFYIVGPAEQR